MFEEITACRICGSQNLIPVMSLGELALTGVFPKSKAEHVAGGPVDLVKCNEDIGCGLVQLKQSYSLESMYGTNYGYRSGLNASMVEHLRGKVAKILSLNILEPGDLIIDIGSNDSTTLRAYPRNEFALVGIDPTGIKFSSYYPPEIKLIPEFFSAKAVSRALDNRKAKVITSFSMFYDLEDPVDFAREVAGALHEEGIWVLEQSYLPSMLRTNSFDTICHEHLEFYALRQINWICEKVGLKVLDVEFNDVNGGSFSIIVAKSEAKHIPNHGRISDILADEHRLSLSKADAFANFRANVEEQRRSLTEFLADAKSREKSVYALGASTKGNVLLQYYRLDTCHIEAIGEVNADKFGSYSPGSLIPIISEDEVLSCDPDYILILPWHFRSFFENSKKLKGRTLVFPLPTLEIVTL